MDKYNSREEVPEKYKWNLDDFYKSDEEFLNELKNCDEQIKEIDSFIGCTKDSNKLYEYLKFDIELSLKIVNLYVYSMLKNDEELGIAKNEERMGKIEYVYSKYDNKSNFFAPELLKLTKEEYNSLFENKKILEYKFALDNIYRSKEHVLSESEEKIISELCNSMDHFSNISSTMLNSEHDYGKVMIDNKLEDIRITNLGRLLKNKDKNIRKEVYEKYRNVLKKYSATSASLLNSYVKKNNSVSKIRKFNSSWDEHLFSERINQKMVDSLVNTTEENLDILHKYFKMYKKILGLNELNVYDLRLDLVEKENYTIDDSISLIRESLKPLGEKYISCYDKIIKNRYIDFCEYKGKCSGGYSANTPDHDSRILLSFNGNLESVSTIAHECGHNINYQIINENNPICYRETSTIVCEVMSLTNELLLSNYLIEHGKNENEKLSGIVNILNIIENNLFDAVREGKMEYDFYKYSEEGNTITNDYMNNLTLLSMKKYFGDAVTLDDLSGLSWITRSHYYNNFYLYSYAFSISVACFIAENIIKGNKKVLDKYLEFLKVGSDKTIKEAFNVLDVDLEDKKVYEYAINYFNDLIDKFIELKK